MVGITVESKSKENSEPSCVMEEDGYIQRQAGTKQQQDEEEEERAVLKNTITPSWTVKQASRQEEGEDEAIFKKPVVPRRTQKRASKLIGPEEDEEEGVFKKPALPSRPKKQTIKPVGQEGEGDGVFKKPVLPSRTVRQATKPEGQEEEKEQEGERDAVFKKPALPSRGEEKDEAVFKKPVFLSRVQRQSSRPDGQDKEESNSIKKQNTTSGLKAASSLESSAQSLVERSALPYKEPEWSGVPQGDYSFEVLKGGVITEVIPLTSPFIVIGRQSQCDLVQEHPSLSRYHCVIQYRAVSDEGAGIGFYAYDLNSTHGSYHNKHRMKPNTYYRLHVGHMLKLAGSTRTLILQGPEEDQEPESELSASELMSVAAECKKKLEQLEEGKDESRRKKEEVEEKKGKQSEEEEQDTGIDWGMKEDAVEEDDDDDDEEEEEEEEEDGEGGGKNPFASPSEELHLDDPKKTLKGWFERHGHDPPNYILAEVFPGCCKCTVELPLESPGRAPLVVSVEHRGRRKDAVVQCAMEACRTLDRRHLLRQAKHESHQPKRHDWAENDYYDSDEDDFFDRTGDIQRRRLKRMKASSALRDPGGAETYDSLMKKYKEATEELADLEKKLAVAETMKEASKGRRATQEEDLDSYIVSLSSEFPDKHKRVTWKLRAIELRKEELKLRRLVNIARPLGVPELAPYQSQHGASAVTKAPQGPGRGARLKGLTFTTTATTTSKAKEPSHKVHKIFMEEEPESKLRLRKLDEDDDDEVKPIVRLSSSKPHKRYARPVHTTDAAAFTVHQKNNEPQALVQTGVENKSLDRYSVQTEVENERLDRHSVQTGVKNESPEKPNKILKEIMERKDSSEGNANLVELSSKEVCDSEEITKKPEAMEPGSTSREDVSVVKKPRVLGPTLPPHLTHLKASSQDSARPRKKEKKKNKYDEDDPNYDTWIPPSHQSGDGRTALNDRLGY